MISGRKTSTFPLKINLRTHKELELPSIPLATRLKTHLGVEVYPQDGKSLRVCVK